MANNKDLSEQTQKLIPMLYQDALQPGVKQIGTAVENVAGLLPALTSPLKFLTDKSRLLLASHLETYRKKLEHQAQEKITPVAPEIAVPIIEKLTYTTDQHLSDLLIELLTKASQTEEVQKVHPSFAGIVSALCPDEARLIKFLAGNIEARLVYPIIDIRLITYHGMHVNGSDEILNSKEDLREEGLANAGIERVRGPLTNWDLQVELDFEDNLSAYVQNLSRLGVLVIDYKAPVLDKNLYAPIRQRISGYKNKPEWPPSSEYELLEGSVEITEFGRLFLRACAQK